LRGRGATTDRQKEPGGYVKGRPVVFPVVVAGYLVITGTAVVVVAAVRLVSEETPLTAAAVFPLTKAEPTQPLAVAPQEPRCRRSGLNKPEPHDVGT
jgi:hypothetical protein